MSASTSGTHILAGDADVARVAALIGEPARAKVLLALSDGRALPASHLAAEAGVSASTISEHLALLCEAKLVSFERAGRSRYFRLRDPSVARALEALAEIAPLESIRSLRQGTRAHALRQARTCYQHLAGRLGVAVMTALIERDLLVGEPPAAAAGPASQVRFTAADREVSYRITAAGRRRFHDFGLDLGQVERHHPPLRHCLDWSEQRHHLAGALGAALTTRLFDLDWIRRNSRPRAVTLTDAGRAGLNETFGVPLDWDRRQQR